MAALHEDAQHATHVAVEDGVVMGARSNSAEFAARRAGYWRDAADFFFHTMRSPSLVSS
jgi:hypothetical protein